MPNRAHIEEVLRKALDHARMNYRIKSMDFESVNHSEHLRNATAERAEAQAELALALQRFNDFVSKGVIPDDLADKSKSATQV